MTYFIRLERETLHQEHSSFESSFYDHREVRLTENDHLMYIYFSD